jgi:hypothetical protein
MPLWGWIAVAYAAVMGVAAAAGFARRRRRAIIASVLYGLASAALSLIDDTRAHVLVPAAMTLIGYWISGLFIGQPQPRLEQWLLNSDRRLFERFHVNRVLAAVPRWVLESVEFTYSTVYLVVMFGAFLIAPLGREAILYYWAVVVPAELVCCAALPFLRCRPPRSLEHAGVIARRNPAMRRVNDLIVNRGSIQVNTIPSAHVAAALASGLAVFSWQPLWGATLIGGALLIGIAATVGRYHYAVDCVLGAVVALVIWLLV